MKLTFAEFLKHVSDNGGVCKLCGYPCAGKYCRLREDAVYHEGTLDFLLRIGAADRLEFEKCLEVSTL